MYYYNAKPVVLPFLFTVVNHKIPPISPKERWALLPIHLFFALSKIALAIK